MAKWPVCLAFQGILLKEKWRVTLINRTRDKAEAICAQFDSVDLHVEE